MNSGSFIHTVSSQVKTVNLPATDAKEIWWQNHFWNLLAWMTNNCYSTNFSWSPSDNHIDFNVRRQITKQIGIMRDLLKFSGTVVWGGLRLGYGKGNLVRHSNIKPQKHVISHSKAQKRHLATRTTKSVTLYSELQKHVILHSETLKSLTLYPKPQKHVTLLSQPQKKTWIFFFFFSCFEDYFHSFILMS